MTKNHIFGEKWRGISATYFRRGTKSQRYILAADRSGRPDGTTSLSELKQKDQNYTTITAQNTNFQNLRDATPQGIRKVERPLVGHKYLATAMYTVPLCSAFIVDLDSQII